MNKEQVMNVMGHIDPALVEGADMGRHKKRLPRAARAGLIAACLCVALVGTAFAVEAVFGIPVFKTMDTSPVTGEPITGFQNILEDGENGVSKLSEDMFSDEVLAMATQMGNGQTALDFESWDEWEAYLGVDVMNNSKLASAVPGQVYHSESDGAAASESTCRATLFAIDGNLTAARGAAAYFMNDATTGDGNSAPVRVGVAVNVYTEHSPIETEDMLAKYGFPEDYVLTTENYITPNGLAALIVGVSAPEDSGTTYYAQFVWNSAVFTVDSAFVPNSGHALATLKEVLDAFE